MFSIISPINRGNGLISNSLMILYYMIIRDGGILGGRMTGRPFLIDLAIFLEEELFRSVPHRHWVWNRLMEKT